MAIEQTKTMPFKKLLAQIRSGEYGYDALDLSYQGLNDKNIRDLVVALKCNWTSQGEAKIKHLKLSGCPLSAQAVQELLNSTLDTRGNVLANSDKPLVPEFSLVTLDLSRGGLSAEGFEELCQCLPYNKTLKTLNISDNQLSGEKIRKLADMLGSGELLGGRDGMANPPCNHTLEELDLSYNAIGEEGAGALAKVVEKSDCSLANLNLSGCGIGFTSAKIFMKAISINTSIRTLALDESCVPVPVIRPVISHVTVFDSKTIRDNRSDRAARNAQRKAARRIINGGTKNSVVEKFVFEVVPDEQAAADEVPVLSPSVKKESRARASVSVHEPGGAPLNKTPALILGSALSTLLSNKTITCLKLFTKFYVSGRQIVEEKKLDERLRAWLTQNFKNQVQDNYSPNRPIKWGKVCLQEEYPLDLEELLEESAAAVRANKSERSRTNPTDFFDPGRKKSNEEKQPQLSFVEQDFESRRHFKKMRFDDVDFDALKDIFFSPSLNANEVLYFDECQFQEPVFKSVDMTPACFIQCDLSGANFRDAKNFNRARLEKTCLKNADLAGLDLRQSDVGEFKFEESLEGYFLKASDLSEANLARVTLDIRSAYALCTETKGLSPKFISALDKEVVGQFQASYREKLEKMHPRTHEFLYGKKGSFFPGFFSWRKFNPLAENLTLKKIIAYIDSQDSLGSRSRRICCDASFRFEIPNNIANLNFSDGFYVSPMASADDFAASLC